MRPAWSEVQLLKNQLDSAQAELDAGWAELASGEAELASGQTELEDNRAKIEEAKAELDDAQNEIDKIEHPRHISLGQGYQRRLRPALKTTPASSKESPEFFRSSSSWWPRSYV